MTSYLAAKDISPEIVVGTWGYPNKVHKANLGKYVELSYLARSGKRDVALKLKKKIPVDDMLLEVIGLMIGDGVTSKKTIDKVKFTNSSPELVEMTREFFSSLFSITKSDFRYEIGSTDSVGVFYDCFRKKKKSEVEAATRKFWRNELALSNDTKITMYWKRVKGKRRPKKYGHLSVVYHNMIAKEVLNRLVDYVKQKALNPKASWAVLRGLFAAEGSLYTDKYGFLKDVSIDQKDKETCSLIEKLFANVGINRKFEKGNGCMRIRIHGRKNFFKLAEGKLCCLDKQKSKKFETALKKSRKRDANPRLVLYKILTSLDSPKTRSELTVKLGLSPRYICGVVKGNCWGHSENMLENGVIRVEEKRGTLAMGRKMAKFYSITGKGKTRLKKLKTRLKKEGFLNRVDELWAEKLRIRDESYPRFSKSAIDLGVTSKRSDAIQP